MTPTDDILSNFGLSRIAHEIAMTKMAIDSLTSELRHEHRLAALQKPDGFMKATDEWKILVRENFKEWRDYLHKYVIVMMAIAGFFTTLMSANWTRVIPDQVTVYWAFSLMGGSIFMGLTAIFFTIFIERQIIDSHVLFELPTKKDRDPDMNPIDSHKIGSRESIAENEAKLEQETDPVQCAILRNKIRADKRHLRLMYFVAAPVSWYEYVRVGATALMIILSLIGIALLMRELLVSSVSSSTNVNNSISIVSSVTKSRLLII
jgi:hypothetical protein